MYSLHKNAIITGSFNSFCLACDCLLTSEPEASEHIGTSSHQSKLAQAQYAPKFKDEHIWKFKFGYFCEFCNVLMPIAAKVTLHVSEEEHLKNKGHLLLKASGKGVIAYNNILIDESSWHGLMEEICSVCNIEFDEKDQHIQEAKHGLNLVLKPVKFGENKGIYRQIDDSAFQCLTCNVLLAPDKMGQHFNDHEHHKLFSKCQIEFNVKPEPSVNKQLMEAKLTAATATSNEKSDTQATEPKEVIKNDSKASTSKNQNTINILDSISKYQSNSININLETDSAHCKKCLVDIEFSCDIIDQHIKQHSKTPKADSELLYPINFNNNLNKVNVNERLQTFSQERDEELEDSNTNNVKMLTETQTLIDDLNNTSECEDNDKSERSTPSPVSFDSDLNNEKSSFAKTNNITYNVGKRNAFCRTCRVKLPSLLKSMQEHVAGVPHKKMVAQFAKAEAQRKASATNLSKESQEDFIESAIDINFDGNEQDSVINEKFYISQYSFYLINNVGSKRRCMLCLINLPYHTDLSDHVETFSHKVAMNELPVVTSVQSEFIREIRPDHFHCGFCHLVVAGWKNMEDHLKCPQHQKNKILAFLRLEKYMPLIRQHRMRQNMQNLAFFHLMSNMAGLSNMFG